MNAYKKLLASARGGTQMTDYFRRIFVVSVLVAGMLALLAAPAAGTESYTSAEYEYPNYFVTHYPLPGINVTEKNKMSYMDATHFAGKDVVLFTVQAYDATAAHYLYWYTPGADQVSSGSVDISDNPDLNFRFKTCVFTNTLYIFYTTDSGVAAKYGFDSTKIYYRTVTVDYAVSDTNPNGWTLVFSEQKYLSGAGWPAIIQMAAVMNGKMYIIFSSPHLTTLPGSMKWDYISSSDGLTFGQATQFRVDVDPSATYASYTTSMASGSVFLAPDPNNASNFVEKLMIAQGWGVPARSDISSSTG